MPIPAVNKAVEGSSPTNKGTSTVAVSYTHLIEKAVIISDGETIPAEMFQLVQKTENPETETSTLEDMEKAMIRKALDKYGGNLSAVAAQLGITRQTLYNKMKKFGL